MKDILLIIFVTIIVFITLYIVDDWNKKNEKILEKTSVDVFEGPSEIEELPQQHLQNNNDNEYQGFRAFNPSITTFNDMDIISFRVSNYTGCSLKSGKTENKKPVRGSDVKSFTILNVNGKDNIYVSTPDYSHQNCAQGFEDVRLLPNPDGTKLHLITGSRSNSKCFFEMYLLTVPLEDLQNVVETKSLTKKLNVTDILRLYHDPEDGEPKNHEKNWMPFFHNDRLHFIYSVEPHVILECDTETGFCNEVYKTSNSDINNELRGSSQPRLYVDENGEKSFVTITHWRTSNISYLTQAYKFEAKPPFKITGMSPTFIFDDVKTKNKSSIQFVSGFEIKDDIAYITYGEQDCDSKLFKVEMKKLMDSMEPIDVKNTVNLTKKKVQSESE